MTGRLVGCLFGVYFVGFVVGVFLRCHHSEGGSFFSIFSIMQPIAKQGLNSIIMKA